MARTDWWSCEESGMMGCISGPLVAVGVEGVEWWHNHITDLLQPHLTYFYQFAFFLLDEVENTEQPENWVRYRLALYLRTTEESKPEPKRLKVRILPVRTFAGLGEPYNSGYSKFERQEVHWHEYYPDKTRAAFTCRQIDDEGFPKPGRYRSIVGDHFSHGVKGKPLVRMRILDDQGQLAFYKYFFAGDLEA